MIRAREIAESNQDDEEDEEEKIKDPTAFDNWAEMMNKRLNPGDVTEHASFEIDPMTIHTETEQGLKLKKVRTAPPSLTGLSHWRHSLASCCSTVPLRRVNACCCVSWCQCNVHIDVACMLWCKYHGQFIPGWLQRFIEWKKGPSGEEDRNKLLFFRFCHQRSQTAQWGSTMRQHSEAAQ